MTTRLFRHRRLAIALLALLPIAPASLAKGNGAGFWLEGTVSNVRASGRFVQVVVKGRMWLEQYPDRSHTPQIVDFPCSQGIAATLTEFEMFFAMTTDWHGGALRKRGSLFEILSEAETRGNVVKLELMYPRIDFAGAQCPPVTSEVIRATDVDLH
jgi:hypothetical protein